MKNILIKISLVYLTCFGFFIQGNSQSLIIGTGSSNTNGSNLSDPVEGASYSFRYQIVYTASELSNSLVAFDIITALGFSISQQYDEGPLKNYEISMAHVTNVNCIDHNLTTTTIVRNSADYTPVSTTSILFDTIHFDQNFIWNGVDNILINICSSGSIPSSGNFGGLRTTTMINGSRIKKVNGITANTICDKYTTIINDYRPNIQFIYTNATPPTCLPPSNLTITSIAPTTATINWTNSTDMDAAANYNWEIQPKGVAQGTSGAITGNGMTGLQVSGLTAETDYDVFVQTICFPTYSYPATSLDSSWVGPIYFTTPCTYETTDYSHDFTGFINGCWEEKRGNFPTSTILKDSISSWVEDGFANAFSLGAARITFGSSIISEWLITPSIDLASTPNLQLELDISLTEASTDYATVLGIDDTLAIVISTDNGMSWSKTNTLQFWSQGTEPSNLRDNIVIDLSAYSGVVKFGIYVTSTINNSDAKLFIDNFKVRQPPLCSGPTEINVSNYNPNDVVINWTNSVSASAVDYNWEVQPQGTSQGIANTTNGSTAMSGVQSLDLSDYTNYDVFVQTNCGVSGNSEWVGPIKFETPCAYKISDYNEDFSAYLDECWSESKGQLSASNTLLNSRFSNWQADGFINFGNLGGARMNITGTNQKEWLISPSIDLGISNELLLEVDIALTNHNGNNSATLGSDDSLAIVISTDNGTTWNTSNILKTWKAGTEPSHTGDWTVLDLSAYSGVVKFGFYATSSIANTNTDLSIDNFWIKDSTFVSSMSVDGEYGVSFINTDGATLQMVAEVLPLRSNNSTFVWSVINGTGAATIDVNGLLTPQANGIVTVKVTSLDGSGIFATVDITISNQFVNVSSINIQGQGGVSTITTNAATLIMEATVLPTYAATQSYVWSVVNGSGSATINSSGLLTPLTNGDVTVKATSTGPLAIVGTKVITISNQHILVNSITVQGQSGATAISTNAGTLQMLATLLPTNVTTSTYTWFVENGTGSATISSSGVLTAITDGDVTVKAYANDISGVVGEVIISISNQIVLVSSIVVQGQGGVDVIIVDAGTLQMEAVISPSNVSNGTYIWSVTNGTGAATIDANGLLTSSVDGYVIVVATSTDGSGKTGNSAILISNQLALVNSITVQGFGGVSTISTNTASGQLNAGTLQIVADVLPVNATDDTFVWAVDNITGSATIDANGVLTAFTNGTVLVKAIANDASSVIGTKTITISNQDILTASITVQGQGGVTTIPTTISTLQMEAVVLPGNASDNTYTWSIVNGSGMATIDANGLVTASAAGDVTITATTNDVAGVSNSVVITILNIVVNPPVYVNSITVQGQLGVSSIATNLGTLQMEAIVMPSNADDLTYTWSITTGSNIATIDANGLLTASADGDVTVIATANDVTGVVGTAMITISNQDVLVVSIAVQGQGGANVIDAVLGNLQMEAIVMPAYATVQSYTWSVVNGTGAATIDANGILTALNDGDGEVTVFATSDGLSGTIGSTVITISNQNKLITNIDVQGQGGISTISTNAGTLQMQSSVLPLYATNQNVTWSITNGIGIATIEASGLLMGSGNGNGDVEVTATAIDMSGITGSITITVSNQDTLINLINVQGQGGINSISVDNGTLQMEAIISPLNPTNSNYIWSVINGTGQAFIDLNGLLTATQNGDVTVVATANDVGNAIGTQIVSISNQQTVNVLENTISTISIYPNPTKGFINITTDDIIKTVKIYCVSGKLLLSNTSNSNTLNISNLKNGFYVVEVHTTNGKSSYCTIVKQ